MFITKVEVFFFSKNDKLPVSMQLRTMENGYPTKEILPFSEVALNPEDVKVSSDATVSTTFEFPAPIYLTEGEEYCFVLLSVADDYRVHISVMNTTAYDGTAIAHNHTTVFCSSHERIYMDCCSDGRYEVQPV